jgi:hypothetical protein
VDRFGSRQVMTIGIAVVAVSSVLAGFSQSFAQLLVLRGVGGLGSAMFSVSAQALLLASVPSGQRGRASGLYTGGFPARRDHWPGARRGGGRLVAARAFLPVRRAARGAGGDRRGRARAGGASGDPRATPSPRESLTVLAGALRSRACQAVAAVNLADGFAVLGIRGAIIPLFVRGSLHRSATWTASGS